MYSLGLYIMLAIIDINLTWFAVADKGSEYWKDLVAWMIATLLTAVMAQAAVSGTVILSDGTYLNDPGLMWLGYLIATCQGIYFLVELIEAAQVYKDEKRKRLIQ